MKTFLLMFLTLGAVCLAADQPAIAIKITDAKGLPIAGAQAVAILKSGAYQDCKCDEVDGQFKCQPTEQCVKIYAAAPGFEASCTKYSGAAGTTSLALKQSATKNSAVLRGRSLLPGIDGELGPRPEANRVRVFAWKIALLEGGRPVRQQSLVSGLNQAIDAQSPTGQKFKIWVMDVTPGVSLVEFTSPK